MRLSTSIREDDPLDALSPPVRLAATLATKLSTAELLDENAVGRVACLAAARFCAPPSMPSADKLIQLVLGFLLTEHIVLSELRVLLVERAVSAAYDSWKQS
jgi:hypothetical protein